MGQGCDIRSHWSHTTLRWGTCRSTELSQPPSSHGCVGGRMLNAKFLWCWYTAMQHQDAKPVPFWATCAFFSTLRILCQWSVLLSEKTTPFHAFCHIKKWWDKKIRNNKPKTINGAIINEKKPQTHTKWDKKHQGIGEKKKSSWKKRRVISRSRRERNLKTWFWRNTPSLLKVPPCFKRSYKAPAAPESLLNEVCCLPASPAAWNFLPEIRYAFVTYSRES